METIIIGGNVKMAKVYIVSEIDYKKAYYAEPFRKESIIKVFDDYHKVVGFICDTIKEDHKQIDESKIDPARWRKYEPDPDEFVEGVAIKSNVYDHCNYYKLVSYKFRSYEVE